MKGLKGPLSKCIFLGRETVRVEEQMNGFISLQVQDIYAQFALMTKEKQILSLSGLVKKCLLSLE
jgi:hypothetical protein